MRALELPRRRFAPLVRHPRAVLALALCVVTVAPSGVRTQQPIAQLSSADVLASLTASAGAIGDPTLAVAVVDRGGRILGVYARPGADPLSWDVAVTTARTAALFSNAQAPLSSRTVRFISGIHFPPGVPNTPVAALYGIENTNRGCQITADPSVPFDRPRSIAGAGLTGGSPLPCNASDPSGCAVGNPIRVGSFQNTRVGFSTGKADVLDMGAPLNVPSNPGGFALYRNGEVIGAVGVAGVTAERAEFAAFVGALLPPAQISPLPFNPLPPPGAVFIEGIRLPFFADCTSVDCVLDTIALGPPRGGPGAFNPNDLIVQPRAGQAVPEGYLIGPFGSAVSGSLSEAEVRRIVDQAVARASLTRAQIRLPLSQTTRMIISVSDETGRILAVFRMPDATVFSLDVATAKARNAYYFSTREGYNVLRGFVDRNRDGYTWEPDPPAGQGWAITNRTLSFGGQPLFPPGIDLEKAPTPGPWFELFLYDSLNPCTEGPGPSRGENLQYLNQSGIVWFPGSAPVYKSGRLVGGVGVSGDGVEQDDYVTQGAVEGFDAPTELRVDRSVIRTSDNDTVRLPYWKFPRNPEAR